MTYLQPMEGPTSARRIPGYDTVPTRNAVQTENTVKTRSTGRKQDERPQAPTTLDRLRRMPLSEFGKAGLVVRVHSASLGHSVLFASDNATVANDEGLTVYRAAELIKLVSSETPDLAGLDRRGAAKSAS